MGEIYDLELLPEHMKHYVSRVILIMNNYILKKVCCLPLKMSQCQVIDLALMQQNGGVVGSILFS